MRILIIACVSDLSELHLYKGLVEAGFEVELFCDPRETYRDRLREWGIPVTELLIRNRFDLRAVRAIRRKLKERKFDAIYTPTNRGLSTSVLATLGMKIKLITYRGTMGHLSYFDPASLIAHLNPRVDRIVCNCCAVRDYLLSMRIPRERLAVIYKGHDIAWYTETEKVKLDQFAIPDGAFVVGCVANIRPLKGVDILLKAAARIKGGQPVHYLIVGELRDQKLPRLAEKLGIAKQVHFCGFRSDAKALTGACNLTVMPSLEREGVPRAVVESMAQQVPVIVTAVGGMPELVEHGVSGLVIPKGDPEALAEGMRFFYERPEQVKQYSQHAQARIREQFHIQGYIDSMVKLCKQIAVE